MKELLMIFFDRFYVTPLVNVDGYMYTRTKERLHRKNMATLAQSTCIGVDLNRNFNGFNSWAPSSGKPAKCLTYNIHIF